MKRTISLFLLVFLLLGAVQAQEAKYIAGGTARQMALGGSPTNAFMMDYTDVYTNPAWAVKYGDLIYSELGYSFAGYRANGQSAGFTYAVTSGMAVGLSIGRQEGALFAANSYGPQFSAGTPFGTNVAVSDDFLAGMNAYITGAGFPAVSSSTLRPLQAYAAFKLSGMSLGVAIYRVSFSYSEDSHFSGDTVNAKTEASVGQTGFKAGMLMDLDVMLLDVSALLRFNGATAKYTPPPPVPPALSGNQEVDASGTELALNARLFIKLSDKFTFVPMARFATFGYEPETKVAVPAGTKINAKPNKYGRTDIEFGVGANITVPGGRVFTGLSLESISLTNDVTSFVGGGTTVPVATLTRTSKYTTSVLSLPKVTLGAEFEIASWLTGRLGYFKAFASRTFTEEAPSPAKKQEIVATYEFQYMPACSLAVADQLLSVGMGIHFDRLSFDGYLCEQWLSNGPYIVSGVGTAMFGVLSMSYRFN